MKWQTCIVLASWIAVCGSLHAQTAIMGHHLGETASQFLVAEPALAVRIDGCRAAEPKPMTPGQIHALSKQDAYALGEQVFTRASQSPDNQFPLRWVPNKGQLEDLARRGMPIVIDKRMPDEIATCHSLLALTSPPRNSPMVVQSLPNTRLHPVMWHFAGGVLTEIDIDFHGADFNEVANDVSNKTGVKPHDDKEVDTPNLYSALIHVYRKATWLTPELYALLESDQGIADGQMHFSVITRAAYDAWAKVHAKKSFLD
jgi:hypothetical protein